MKEMIRHESQVNGVLVFVTFLFGINPIVVKMGITSISPYIFTTGRLFIAVIAFSMVLKLSGTWKKVEKKDITTFMKMGIEAFIFQLGMITALKFVSAAVVATMIGLTPISVLLIHTRLGSKKINSYHYYGAACTFLGVFLVSGIIGGPMKVNPASGLIGVLILLLAQYSAAKYMARSEELLVDYSHYQVSTLMFTGALIIFIIITAPEVLVNGLPVFTKKVMGYMVYGGVVSLCIANNLWIWGIKKIGSHKAVIFNNLPPVFALLTGIVFLNEIPLPSQVLGVVMVLIGLYVFDGKMAHAKEN